MSTKLPRNQALLPDGERVVELPLLIAYGGKVYCLDGTSKRRLVLKRESVAQPPVTKDLTDDGVSADTAR